MVPVFLQVGADGNFFTFNMMGHDQLEEKVAVAKAKIPSAKVKLTNRTSKRC